jgi:hypothetical protein
VVKKMAELELMPDEQVLAAFNGKLSQQVLDVASRVARLTIRESELLSEAGDCKREMEKIEVDLRIAVADEKDANGKARFSNEQRREDEVKIHLRGNRDHRELFAKMRASLNALVFVRAEMQYLKDVIAISRLYDPGVQKNVQV